MTLSPRETMLATTDWLEGRLDDPTVRIVDMRGLVRTVDVAPGRQVAEYLGRPADYAAGHIPYAIYLDWTVDIVDPDDPIKAQLAGSERFAAELGRRGIGDEHLVVAYDDHPTAQFATRLWWALQYYGHDRAMVLDGGLA
jgi:thiosulfate/3-mercaptopyruvate sulfurtransferase